MSWAALIFTDTVITWPAVFAPAAGDTRTHTEEAVVAT